MKRTSTKKSKIYRKPKIRTSDAGKLLKKLGPAQTCSPTPAQCPTAD